ncbi:unnamed protein product [Peniophora sp. CBMAI 1063]|nr:unnamed protein product [Peniophora sp. CBMAI 1063]
MDNVINIVPQPQTPPHLRKPSRYEPTPDKPAHSSGSSRLPFGNVANSQRPTVPFGISKDPQSDALARLFKLFNYDGPSNAFSIPGQVKSRKSSPKPILRSPGNPPVKCPEDFQARILATRARLARKFGSSDFPLHSETVIRPLPPHSSPADVLDLIRRRRTPINELEGFSDYGSMLCRQAVSYAAAESAERAERNMTEFEERLEDDRRRLLRSAVVAQRAKWIAELVELEDEGRELKESDEDTWAAVDDGSEASDESGYDAPESSSEGGDSPYSEDRRTNEFEHDAEYFDEGQWEESNSDVFGPDDCSFDELDGLVEAFARMTLAESDIQHDDFLPCDEPELPHVLPSFSADEGEDEANDREELESDVFGPAASLSETLDQAEQDSNTYLESGPEGDSILFSEDEDLSLSLELEEEEGLSSDEESDPFVVTPSTPYSRRMRSNSFMARFSHL